LTGVGFVEHIVRVVVAVKVGGRHQRPPTRDTRPISAPDKGWSR
jgi:hypothetical protein